MIIVRNSTMAENPSFLFGIGTTMRSAARGRSTPAADCVVQWGALARPSG
jgi:hypothetical protein